MCERERMGPPPPGNYWLCRRPVREGSVRDGGGEESPRGLCSGAQSLSQIQHSFPLLTGLRPQPNRARPSGEDCFYMSISMHSRPCPSLNLASLGHSIAGSRPVPPVMNVLSVWDVLACTAVTSLLPRALRYVHRKCPSNTLPRKKLVLPIQMKREHNYVNSLHWIYFHASISCSFNE